MAGEVSGGSVTDSVRCPPEGAPGSGDCGDCGADEAGRAPVIDLSGDSASGFGVGVSEDSPTRPLSVSEPESPVCPADGSVTGSRWDPASGFFAGWGSEALLVTESPRDSATGFFAGSAADPVLGPALADADLGESAGRVLETDSPGDAFSERSAAGDAGFGESAGRGFETGSPGDPTAGFAGEVEEGSATGPVVGAGDGPGDGPGDGLAGEAVVGDFGFGDAAWARGVPAGFSVGRASDSACLEGVACCAPAGDSAGFAGAAGFGGAGVGAVRLGVGASGD
ncbi:MAG: hypothetical protein ACRDTB_34625, partial [Actinophytocola sp.]